MCINMHHAYAHTFHSLGDLSNKAAKSFTENFQNDRNIRRECLKFSELDTICSLDNVLVLSMYLLEHNDMFVYEDLYAWINTLKRCHASQVRNHPH